MSDLVFEKLKMKNFQCYSNENVEFSLGSNSIYGPNGSGKSTILKAISSSMFQSKGVKKYNLNISDLIKSDADQALVKLHFSTSQKSYSIAWEINQSGTKKCVLNFKNKERKIKGFKNVKNYLHSNNIHHRNFFDFYVKQREIDIIDRIDSKDRQKMLDKFLGLEKLDNYKDNMKYSRREVKTKISEINGSIKELENQDGQKNLKELEKTIKLKEKKVSSLTNKIKEKEQEIDTLRRKKEKMKSQLDTDEEDIKTKINEKEKDKEKLQKEVEEIKTRIEKTKNQLQDIKKNIKKQNSLPSISTFKKANSSVVVYGNKQIEIDGITIPEIEINSPEQAKKVNFKNILQPIQEKRDEKIQYLTKQENKKSTNKSKIDKKKKQIKETNRKIQENKHSIQKNYNKIINTLKESEKEEQPFYIKIIKVIISFIGYDESSQREKLLSQIENPKGILQRKGKIIKVDESLSNKIIDLRDKIRENEEHNKRNRSLKNEINNLENQIYNIEQRVKTKRAEKEQIEEVINVLSQWKEKQNKNNNLQQEKQKLEDKIENLQERNKEKKELIKEKEEYLEKNKRKGSDKKPQEIEEAISDKQEEINNIKQEISSLKENKSELQQEIIDLKQKKDQAKNLEERKEKLKANKQKLEKTKKEINEIIEYQKNIKHRKRRKAIQKVENLSNQIFQDIYNSSTYTSINIDDEFNIQIKNTNGKLISPNQLSGGEKILISIAIRCSICKTIQEYIDTIQMPLILDEPTYNLDTGHSRKLQKLIDQLEQWFKQVIIVSHNDNIIETSNNIIKTEIENKTNKVKQETL